MEPIEFSVAAIAYPFLVKYVEKAGEGLSEKTLEQAGKLWQRVKAMPGNTFAALKPAQENPFPEDFEAAIREMEAVANQNPEFKQDIIDVVAVAKEEHPEDVKKIEAEIEKIQAQGPTVQNYGKLAEEIRNLIQGSIFHGGKGGIHF